jgi:beta-glucanase (GH16 family)
MLPEYLNQTDREDVPQIVGYSLLWNDEFNGDTLEEENWTREVCDPFCINNELQAYTAKDENIFIKDGTLVLKAIRTTDEEGNLTYTSGKVTSQSKQDFLYGKVVVSAKVPEGQGLWPAIWMMPQDPETYGLWPECGEIDVMEILGNQTNIAYQTLNYGEPHCQQQAMKMLDGGSFSDSFHEYSVEWEPGEIRFYIDGERIQTMNDWFTADAGGDEEMYPAPFDQAFFVQMNLAVGGDWPGNPDETTDFSKAEFIIDYVRVYRKAEYDTNVTKPDKVFRQPTADGNLIYNGDFAETTDLSGQSDWFFRLYNGGMGFATVVDRTIVITSEKEGTENYSIQLVQPNLPLIHGQKYRITFDAKAAEARNMTICVSAPMNGWICYLPENLLKLNTEWTTFTYEFEMTGKDDNNALLEFNMGQKGSIAEISLRNVRLVMIE